LSPAVEPWQQQQAARRSRNIPTSTLVVPPAVPPAVWSLKEVVDTWVSETCGDRMSITIEDRQVRRRLAILRHAEEVTGNVAMTCRYYGITRQSFYLWKRRYEELGPDGLRDRSRRPKTSPNATHADVVGKILYLRQNYHCGPGKILMYLARYHDMNISSSGVWRILKRLGLIRLPASQRYKRLDRRWQRYESSYPATRSRST
jgi:transposase